jgi:hypothetical protein
VTPKPARGPVRWWLRTFGFGGITLPPAGIFILAERLGNERLVRHEQAHWAQYQRMGFLGFYLTYLYQVLRYSYYNAPMEIEARAAEHD